MLFQKVKIIHILYSNFIFNAGNLGLSKGVARD